MLDIKRNESPEEQLTSGLFSYSFLGLPIFIYSIIAMVFAKKRDITRSHITSGRDLSMKISTINANTHKNTAAFISNVHFHFPLKNI